MSNLFIGPRNACTPEGWNEWVYATDFIDNVEFSDIPFPPSYLPAQAFWLESVISHTLWKWQFSPPVFESSSRSSSSSSSLLDCIEEGKNVYGLGLTPPSQPFTYPIDAPFMGYCVGKSFKQHAYTHLRLTETVTEDDEECPTTWLVSLAGKNQLQILQHSRFKRIYIDHGFVKDFREESAQASSEGEPETVYVLTLDLDESIVERGVPSGIQAEGDKITITGPDHDSGFEVVVEKLRDNWELEVSIEGDERPTVCDYYQFEQPWCIEDPWMLSGLWKLTETSSGKHLFYTDHNSPYESGNFMGTYVWMEGNTVQFPQVGSNMNDSGSSEWKFLDFGHTNEVYTGDKRYKEEFSINEVDCKEGQISPYVSYSPRNTASASNYTTFVEGSDFVRVEISSGGFRSRQNWFAPCLENEFIKVGSAIFRILAHVTAFVIDVEKVSVDGSTIFDPQSNQSYTLLNQYAWMLNEHYDGEEADCGSWSSMTGIFRGTVDEAEYDAETGLTTVKYTVGADRCGAWVKNADPTTDLPDTPPPNYLFNTANNFMNRYRGSHPHTEDEPLKKYQKFRGWKLVAAGSGKSYEIQSLELNNPGYPYNEHSFESYSPELTISGDVSADLSSLDVFISFGEPYELNCGSRESGYYYMDFDYVLSDGSGTSDQKRDFPQDPQLKQGALADQIIRLGGAITDFNNSGQKMDDDVTKMNSSTDQQIIRLGDIKPGIQRLGEVEEEEDPDVQDSQLSDTNKKAKKRLKSGIDEVRKEIQKDKERIRANLDRRLSRIGDSIDRTSDSIDRTSDSLDRTSKHITDINKSLDQTSDHITDINKRLVEPLPSLLNRNKALQNAPKDGRSQLRRSKEFTGRRLGDSLEQVSKGASTTADNLYRKLLKKAKNGDDISGEVDSTIQKADNARKVMNDDDPINTKALDEAQAEADSNEQQAAALEESADALEDQILEEGDAATQTDEGLDDFEKLCPDRGLESTLAADGGFLSNQFLINIPNDARIGYCEGRYFGIDEAAQTAYGVTNNESAKSGRGLYLHVTTAGSGAEDPEVLDGSGIGSHFCALGREDRVLYKDANSGKVTGRLGHTNLREDTIKDEVVVGSIDSVSTDGGSEFTLDSSYDRLHSVSFTAPGEQPASEFVTFALDEDDNAVGFPVSGKGDLDLVALRRQGVGGGDLPQSTYTDANGGFISPVYAYENGQAWTMGVGTSTVNSSTGNPFVLKAIGGELSSVTLNYISDASTIGNGAGLVDLFSTRYGKSYMIYGQRVGPFIVSSTGSVANASCYGTEWLSRSAVFILDSSDGGVTWSPTMVLNGVDYRTYILDEEANTVSFFVQCLYEEDSTLAPTSYIGCFTVSLVDLERNLVSCSATNC